MTPSRFRQITDRFADLRLAVVGDFCLDRYLEIDPSRCETSIETGLPVHNVTRVRAQPGAAGTVLNNLVALGVGRIEVVGFCGEDGEGFELQQALTAMPGVQLEHFLCTPSRRTFTYCKPLVLAAEGIPQELNRLDSKNWTPTPSDVSATLAASLGTLSSEVAAMVVMEQVDMPYTGVVTAQLLSAMEQLPAGLPVVADSRRGLNGYPACIYKMNASELAALTQQHAANEPESVAAIQAAAARLAATNDREVVVTLAERGMIGAVPAGTVWHVPAHPARGPIDIVGAGDAVTANLAAALAAEASLGEALEIAAAAAAIVIHQLGTTGTATVAEIAELIAASG